MSRTHTGRVRLPDWAVALAALLKIKHRVSLDELMWRGLLREMLMLRDKPGESYIPIPEELWEKAESALVNAPTRASTPPDSQS